MKPGKTLHQLASELDRQHTEKVDWLAPASQLHPCDETPSVYITSPADTSYGFTQPAHTQFATWLDIPNKFYNKLLAEPHQSLWRDTIEHLLRTEHADDTRLLRTLDGNIRAFLSDRYRPLDHFELFEYLWPVLEQFTGLECASSEITDTHFYLKCTIPGQAVELKRQTNYYGRDHRIETLSPGICISNSETGHGTLSISPLVYTHECTNGVIFKSTGVAKKHLGQSLLGDEHMKVLTNETKRARDQATFMECKDVVLAALDGRTFNEAVEKMRVASYDTFEANEASNLTQKVAKSISLTEGESTGVVERLLRANGNTRLDVVNAITAYASEVPSYDRSTYMEEQAARILDMKTSSWQAFARAA